MKLSRQLHNNNNNNTFH